MMKNLLLIAILLFITNGCSTKVIKKGSNQVLFEENLEQRLGIYGQVYSLSSISPEFAKNNLRYKMLIIDSRVWEKNKKNILKTRRILKQFGKQLGKKAIVLNLILKTSKKRAFFKEIQNRTGDYFDPDRDAPFLIFYRPNKYSESGYVPFKIISLASIHPKYLNKKLFLLGNAIEQGQSKKAIITSLNKINNQIYVKNKSSRKIKEIINIFMEWFL